jgi:peptide/nickel transport system substrate-binding protein
LLAAAGYSDGFQIVLDTPVDRYYQDQAISEAIAAQLAEVGIQVQIQTHPWSTYVSERLIPKETSSLFLLGIASRGNGLEDTANLAADFSFNPTLWRNVEFERLVAEARSTFNNEQRQALLDQAQIIAYEEAPWIWLWRPYDFYGVVSWLEWHPRADGLIYLYKARVSDQ